MTSSLSVLLVFTFVNAHLSQLVFDDVKNETKVIQDQFQELTGSFGGITQGSKRDIRQNKRNNHGFGEHQHGLGERRAGKGGKANHNNAGSSNSLCGMRFQYVTDGREWLGTIRLRNVDVHRETLIEANFALPQGLNRRVILISPIET